MRGTPDRCHHLLVFFHHRLALSPVLVWSLQGRSWLALSSWAGTAGVVDAAAIGNPTRQWAAVQARHRMEGRWRLRLRGTRRCAVEGEAAKVRKDVQLTPQLPCKLEAHTTHTHTILIDLLFEPKTNELFHHTQAHSTLCHHVDCWSFNDAGHDAAHRQGHGRACKRVQPSSCSGDADCWKRGRGHE